MSSDRVGQDRQETSVTRPEESASAPVNGVGKAVPEFKSESNLDPFDPASYKRAADPRLSDYANAVGLPKIIEVRKPDPSWFVRLHQDPGYRGVFPMYFDRGAKRRENSAYLISPELPIPEDLEDLLRDTLLAVAVTSGGISFLYPLNISDSSWYESGLETFRRLTEEWGRVSAGTAGYVVTPPIATLPDPIFPDVPFREYLVGAFSKRLITSLDHPVVKKLRGA
jgi:hypothetical protein